jgi:hypothetical protein
MVSVRFATLLIIIITDGKWVRIKLFWHDGLKTNPFARVASDHSQCMHAALAVNLLLL